MSNLSKECFRVRVSCMTYNHAKFIQDAMNGFCMQQTDFPFICTIFDDNSTDGEQDVIKQYLENNFIINDDTIKMEKETSDYTMIFTRHKSNINCYFAVYFLKYNHFQLNKNKEQYLLLDWIDTKYIALCEGDDYWTDPEKLQMQVDLLELNPDAYLCCHDFIEYYQHKGCFAEQSQYVKSQMNFPSSNFWVFTKDDFIHKYFVMTLSCVYRNGHYIKEIPTKKYKYYRDTIFQYYVLKKGSGIAINKVMGVYRRHQGGIATSLSTQRRFEIRLKIWYDLYHIANEKQLYPIIMWNGHQLLDYLAKTKGLKSIFVEVSYFYQELSFKIATDIYVNYIKHALYTRLQSFS